MKTRRCLWTLVPWLLVGLAAMPTTAFAQGAPAQTSGSSTAQAEPAVVTQQAPPVVPRLGDLKLGLTFEGFYQFNWNRPFDRINLLRAYDTRANTFGIQQTALLFEFAPDVPNGRRFGGRVDLQFGQATETVQGGPANEPRPDVYRNVWQAYGTYVFDVGRGLQLDFGKFASILGYETNYAKDNNQFSRAYLFNFLPFYHSGVRLSVPVGERLTLMYMLTNGIQQTEEFNNFKSNHFAAVVKPTDRIVWTVNYYFGQEQPDGSRPDGPDGYFRVFDTYATYSVTSRLGVGIDLNVVTNQVNRGDPTLSLNGLGAYARYQWTDEGAMSLRYERLDDEGLFGGIAQVLHEVTATVEHKFAEGFLVRGEVRRDWSNQPFFTTNMPGRLRGHQNTALAGLVWWFGNKTGTW
jgi:hypothetical protein